MLFRSGEPAAVAGQGGSGDGAPGVVVGVGEGAFLGRGGEDEKDEGQQDGIAGAREAHVGNYTIRGPCGNSIGEGEAFI